MLYTYRMLHQFSMSRWIWSLGSRKYFWAKNTRISRCIRGAGVVLRRARDDLDLIKFIFTHKAEQQDLYDG